MGTMKQVRIDISAAEKKSGMTQAELARKLGVTRFGINAWEMGITTPSTQYVVELSLLFKVSTDFLLDMPSGVSVLVEGLSDREIASIVEIINCYKCKENWKRLLFKTVASSLYNSIIKRSSGKLQSARQRLRESRKLAYTSVQG